MTCNILKRLKLIRNTRSARPAFTDHTLRELDEHLVEKGFHLDNTLMTKLTRALIYYVEETQLHNIGAPERRLKRSSQEAYGKAWEQHPHGDHDETPPEWREYK